MISFRPGYYGWLGNQMFQYATTFALSKRIGTSCSFPENKPNLHDIFTLSAKKIFSPPDYMYAERKFHFTPLPTDYEDLMIHGYFQSEKYFSDCRDDLKSEFRLRDPKYSEKLDDDYIGIHVRRGDYLTYSLIHPVCSMQYYEEGLASLPDKPVKIFSDDPEWCVKHFKGDRFNICTGNFIEDFELMSKCTYNIIANSSFSWWAAWLSNSKKVIAPKKWFGPKGPGSSKDIIPSEWEIL